MPPPRIMREQSCEIINVENRFSNRDCIRIWSVRLSVEQANYPRIRRQIGPSAKIKIGSAFSNG